MRCVQQINTHAYSMLQAVLVQLVTSWSVSLVVGSCSISLWGHAGYTQQSTMSTLTEYITAASMFNQRTMKLQAISKELSHLQTSACHCKQLHDTHKNSI